MIFVSFALSCDRPAVADGLPKPAVDLPAVKDDAPAEPRVAVFAGGCFWCTEAVFEQLPGVSDVVSGYAGGTRETANYKAVSSGTTDHAEAIRITYDPRKVTYGQLLHLFFLTHDPTTKDRQGPDVGRQYRSAIFYGNEDEKRVAADYIRQLDEAKAFPRPIVTTLEPLVEFFPAEDYHQDFARTNPAHPYIQRWALPKVEKAKKASEK